MRNLILIIILSSTSWASDALRFQIEKNKPGLQSEYVDTMISAATIACDKYGIPVNIIMAIAFVESSYILDAVNGKSNDFGIMQVNQWHVDRSELDKQKLLTDMDYSFYHGVRIFSWFYRTYPLEEAIARYNCGTRPNCIQWVSVKKYVDKVRSAL